MSFQHYSYKICTISHCISSSTTRWLFFWTLHIRPGHAFVHRGKASAMKTCFPVHTRPNTRSDALTWSDTAETWAHGRHIGLVSNRCWAFRDSCPMVVVMNGIMTEGRYDAIRARCRNTMRCRKWLVNMAPLMPDISASRLGPHVSDHLQLPTALNSKPLSHIDNEYEVTTKLIPKLSRASISIYWWKF